MSVKPTIKPSCVHTGSASVAERLEETYPLCFGTLQRRMAFGLDLTGGHVSEINELYMGHCWPTACWDTNNNGDYAQDSSKGEGLGM